ncbi:hypothetical protein JCM12296A_52320 [Desulfosarcina cetonica]
MFERITGTILADNILWSVATVITEHVWTRCNYLFRWYQGPLVDSNLPFLSIHSGAIEQLG